MVEEPVFPGGWEQAVDRNLSFIVNRMNERVIAGQSIDTLLAVLMFVMMGITLERSKIANDLLTTMARVFGPLPGGLAVSIVIVGAFLAASTGIVGATVVTMGLLALPTMLRNNYSPELATGVIAASGTLGQIIPPSIVIVLLGTLAGDMYAIGQETRAQAAGCTDALTYLGEPAVLSVGTLFQAALLPGIFLAGLYALYAFGFALLNPSKAPAVEMGATNSEVITRNEAFAWFLGAPVALIGGVIFLSSAGIIGGQTVGIGALTEGPDRASLRTNVSDTCAASMIELHGQEAWDQALAEAAAIEAAGGTGEAVALTEEELAAAQAEAVAALPPISSRVAVFFLVFALILTTARGIAPTADPTPLMVGGVGVVLAILADIIFITPQTLSGPSFLILGIPFALVAYGTYHAVGRLAQNDLLRVVFPPLVLIVAVLGSILGGITNPTPAAALGAAGAIMLAAYRKLSEEGRGGRIIVMASFALVIMLLLGSNFDLRVTREVGAGAGLDRLSDRAGLLPFRGLRPAFCLLVAVPGQRAEPGGARDGQGHLDGLHHPDWLPDPEPCGDLLRRRALHPGVPAQFRSGMGRVPGGDDHPLHSGLRAGFPGDHLHRGADCRASDLRRDVRSGVGDDHDRHQPADELPDAALRLRAVLPARRGATIGNNRAYLSRRDPVRADPGHWPWDPGALPGDRDHHPRPLAAIAGRSERQRSGTLLSFGCRRRPAETRTERSVANGWVIRRNLRADTTAAAGTGVERLTCESI